MYIDTAPKWPNPPRFRLKRSAVTAMVQSYFNNAQFEELKEHLNSFSEFDQKLHDLTMKYQGKTIAELISILEYQSLILTSLIKLSVNKSL